MRETLTVSTGATYVRPAKRINGDESFHILEGEADFVIFDEQGNIIASVPLGDYDSGLRFYIRVPASAYHTINIKSETLVIQEVQTGPFHAGETVYAPWAPQESDAASVGLFRNRLLAAAKKNRE